MRRSKIAVPLRPPRFVERSTVRAALDEQSEPRVRGRVILVSAPAGYGKTAAVTDWVRAGPRTPTAWVALDAGDREERQWWASVLAALQASPAVVAESPFPGITPSWTGAPERAEFLSAVFDALDGLSVPVRLVLDDVHAITDHPAVGGLLELLRHPFPMLTVVLCSRHDPAIGIDRLRLEGRLGQMRADRLVFTEQDAAELFHREGLDLRGDQTATLVARTEGWVAALRLAALSLHHRSDTAGFVREFAGDDRSVADYLVGEVLSHLGDREHSVLVASTISAPLHIDLAADLTGDEDAADILDRLATTTGMVTATDRRREYYRVHELLRSHTLARVRRARPDHLRELYRRASAWHDTRGDHVEALRCAALSGDIDTTEVLLRARAIELIGRGEFTTLARSEQMIDGAVSDPRVRLVLGLAALESGELGRADELITTAGAEFTGDESDNVTVFRQIVAVRASLAKGRLGDVVDAARAIRPELVEGAALRALALLTRASGLPTIDTEAARRDGTEALALAEKHGWSYLAVQAHSALGAARLFGGSPPETREHARAAIARATSHGWTRSSGYVQARLVLASAELLGGRPEGALAHIAEAEIAEAQTHPHVLSALGTLRAVVDHDTGRPVAGWQQMRLVRIAGAGTGLSDQQVALAGLLEQQAALGLGRAREAAEVTRAVAHQLEGSAEAALLTARLQWATTHDPAARKLLAPLFARRLRLLTSLGIVESLLLDAEIAAARDEPSGVLQQMQRALRIAARRDLLRPLLHLPGTLRDHLAAHQGAFGDQDPLVEVVLTRAASDVPADRDPLTERERAVLAFLPTMRSSTEIAQDLAVSLNTIKTHQRAIYQKLGVTSRRDAVSRARRVGLLDPTRGT